MNLNLKLNILLGNISTYIVENKIEVDTPLLESITYYNLRQFITLMHRTTSDTALKGLFLELLKVLAKLEVVNKPVPAIKKLKSISPEIFPN